MSKTTSEYFEIDVDLDIKSIINKHCKKSVDKLKVKSPKSSGNYASNWTFLLDGSEENCSGTVFNNEPIGHFLEYGHIVGGGWSPAQPHLEPVYEDEKIDFINDMKKINIKVTSKKGGRTNV
ncbi:MAG: HK97 gp10 family phage protein [Erysipelotrichaceae bacterium]